ncbi:MAG: serine hydrolase [Novosphingobium sp.]
MKYKCSLHRLAGIATLAAALVAAPASQAQSGDTSAATLELRRNFMDGTFNTLTFRHVDEIFDTYRVEKGRGLWKLPENKQPFDIGYSFEGQNHGLNDFLERTYTNALLVIRDGKVIHEIYRNKSNPDTHFLSMSMAKSITSMLVGAAIADGHIKSVDDQLVTYVPELKGSAYDGVTIRQTLLMRSGVDRSERYDYKTDHASPNAQTRELSMVQGTRRYRAEALLHKRAYEPGTHYNYSTLDTIVLGWMLERATGQPVQTYMSTRLWQPLGAQSYGYWMTDGPPGVGNAVNGMGFNATLRDYGRLGLMMLNGGVANGRRILPSAWVKESTTPSPGFEPTAAGETTGYQYQWWTYTNSNAYTAIGLQGQFIYVDPDTKLVIVKLSYFPPLAEKPEMETEAFFRAASAWAARQ